MEITSTNNLLQTNNNSQMSLANNLSKVKNNNKLTSAYESIPDINAIDKMSYMKEKYKDVFTPIADDPHSKNIDIVTVLNKYAEIYSGAPIALGENPTKYQIYQQKIAHDKVNAWVVEQVGTLKAIALSRFFNANVYEGLENGKTLVESINEAFESKEAFFDIEETMQKPNSKYENQLLPQKTEKYLGLLDQYNIYDSIDIRG
ncbi:MAG: hypothetical protein L3I99_04720 [Sulfurimonas sp.]|nr:hypothetical protein [Sulfurimonas sp.]